MRTLIALLIVFCTGSVSAQSNFNFDFELVDSRRTTPENWFMGGAKGYRTVLDSTQAYSGKYAVRIERDTTVKEASFGAFSLSLPAEYRGKKLRLEGYIKTENVKDGWAGLWMRIDGTRQFDNMERQKLKGTNDWKMYSIELPLKEKATSIVIGGLLVGSGRMWVDKISLTVDGVAIARAPKIDPAIYDPKPDQIAWLKDNAVPLTTVDAGNGFSDLQSLKDFVGDARIVFLGECTHGTSEIFRMKHRLLEFLASEMDFNIFAIEANMAETNGINDYVLRGIGNPDNLLDTMCFWTWNTKEVQDMIVWMRRYNLEHPDAPLQFAGFDMQFGKGAADNLSRFARQHAAGLVPLTDSIRSLVAKLEKRDRSQSGKLSATRLAEDLASVKKYLETNGNRLSAAAGDEQFAWIAQNVRLLEQFAELKKGGGKGVNIRDKSMAENIDWLLEHNPGSKMVVWAHNGHVNRRDNFMGGYLEKNGHKKDMRVIGFSAGEGTYTAVVMGKGLSSSNELVPPVPRSFERYGRASGLTNFFLDTRAAHLKDTDVAWLTGSVNLRRIGAVAMEGRAQFDRAVLPDLYDAIIYLDKTKASHCFRVR